MLALSSSQWNFFISHASEDKDAIARPLANMLEALGFKVWYDEFTLKLADSLNQSINQGLALSDYGIVILSASFFRKNWPQRELDGLVAQETIFGKRKILPIWHKVNAKKVAKYSPTLANAKAVSTVSNNLDDIVREIIRAVEGGMQMPEGLPSPAYALLLPNDVIVSFRTLDEFKATEIDGESFTNIYQALWILKINTVERLNELVSSQKIIDVLKQVYREELLRPENSLFTPVEFAMSGGYLLTQFVTPSSITELRRMLQMSQEYQQKHPNSNISPTSVVNLNKILTGKQYVDLFENAHLYIADYDQPSNEAEAVLIKELLEMIEYLEVADNSEFPMIALQAERGIQELKRSGYYVYGAAKDGQFRAGDIDLDTRGVYIKILRRDIPVLIGISQSNFVPK
jgi:TIR domain